MHGSSAKRTIAVDFEDARDRVEFFRGWEKDLQNGFLVGTGTEGARFHRYPQYGA
jgi:hypothetical protein